jgi:hypothetical protein
LEIRGFGDLVICGTRVPERGFESAAGRPRMPNQQITEFQNHQIAVIAGIPGAP